MEKTETTLGPSAKIIADSISDQGHRLTTMEVRMHRFILAEMNTHRAFSRNSASSRAIPYDKMAQRVWEHPAFPVHWGAEQKGMQSGDSLDDIEIYGIDGTRACWHSALIDTLVHTGDLKERGLHKSLINRLLEPFMWHTAIITATEWDNFFWQRCHPDAQPEMKAVADEMQRAYFTSTPKVLTHGMWHLPYIKQEDWDELTTAHAETYNYWAVQNDLKQISVARCARVSYLNQDGVRDLNEDFKLFNRLKGSGHWSPFEHVATPVTPELKGKYIGVDGKEVRVYYGDSNFVGWKQFRKGYTDENRTNFIPNLPDLAHLTMKMEAGIDG